MHGNPEDLPRSICAALAACVLAACHGAQPPLEAPCSAGGALAPGAPEVTLSDLLDAPLRRTPVRFLPEMLNLPVGSQVRRLDASCANAEPR